MTLSPLLLYVVVSAVIFPVNATIAQEISGAEVYERWCAGCHAPGPLSPGTVRLTQIRGSDLADITLRQDLPEDYVRILVRKGIGGMPSFRRTEISNSELVSLLEFLRVVESP